MAKKYSCFETDQIYFGGVAIAPKGLVMERFPRESIPVRFRTGHPIRPAGRGDKQRKRIKSSPRGAK